MFIHVDELTANAGEERFSRNAVRFELRLELLDLSTTSALALLIILALMISPVPAIT